MWGFYKLFKKSPMGLILQHYGIAKNAFEICEKNYKLWKSGQPVSIEEVSKIEHEADEVKMKLNSIITTSLMSSLRKEDLLSLIKMQDSVADAAEDVIKYLDFKIFKIDDDILEDIDKIFDFTKKAILEYERLLDNFNKYQRADFAPKYKKGMPMEMENISEFERKVDNAAHDLGKKIFNLEDRYSAVEIFFISKLTTLVDRVTDNLENASDRIKRIIAK
ncbi:DUF47 family protein [bacterium]|nr:DUF47 family protein [bacterium]